MDSLHLVIRPPDSSLLYMGHYDPMLVSLSILVAILASYGAMLVLQHVTATNARRERHFWLAVGGMSMGVGIWAMHFVGMLAFSLPCGSSYDPTITVLSMIPGILSSTLALKAISRQTISISQLTIGGILFGAGIGTMHYSGMAALRIDGLVRYNLILVLLSIIVAVALAMLAIWIWFRLRMLPSRWQAWKPIFSAVVMGLAVSGMHYTAMTAAYFISDGNPSIIDSHITPTFLAAMVLVATVAIIVMTIVVSYISKPELPSFSHSYKSIGLLLLGWWTISWLSSIYYYDQLAKYEYQQSSQQARRLVEQITRNVDRDIQLLKGIALVVALDVDTQGALARFGTEPTPSSLAYAERKRRWTRESQLVELDKSLKVETRYLQADVIWILNTAGDCIASSNADKPANSFVGTNYSDRSYFIQARAGQIGHQYAVGRVSKVPGLYYSAPVIDKGHILGVAVVKLDIINFSYWTDQAKAFISDANGIVVMAPDKSLIKQAMPDASIEKLSTQERKMQYGQTTFKKLKITHWDEPRFQSAVLLGDDLNPIVLSSKTLPEDAISIHVAGSLAELVRLGIQKNWLFVLLGVAGNMLIVAASAIVLYLRQSRKVETDLRLAAAAFEAQEGMIITDSRNVILRVNQAFTDITGYEPEDAVGQTPRILQSGHHDNEFYKAMRVEIERAGTWQGEIWNQHKDGRIYPAWLNITAVKGTDGGVSHYVGTMNDISRRKAAEDEIRHLALYDHLTQLPNRRLLMNRLKQAQAASARSGRAGALLFIDLDNFKLLNDTLGHAKGDLLLQQVSTRLTECVREGDSIARFGGDEFVVMLEDLSENSEEAATQTKNVGEKILITLNRPFILAGHKYHSTSSVGATLFFDHKDSIDELLKQADLAMYQAKAAGRATLRFFDQGMQTVVDARARLESDMRQGLQRNEFILHYQPQIADSDSITGAEVLVRWQHPQHGMVSPAEFIALAEETGLILPLGHQVLESACTQLSTWAMRPDFAHLTLAVNVSARQFRHPDFVDQVLAVVEQAGAPPGKLKLEITESLLLDNIDEFIGKMTELKARGIGFSLDDFGTGYSSLSYLKHLPLDQLKIDQSFVRDILSDPNDAAIARTIVTLAHSLGLSVIAEGVETAAQRNFLDDAGCHAFQGYYFSRPLPLEEFEEFVLRN